MNATPRLWIRLLGAVMILLSLLPQSASASSLPLQGYFWTLHFPFDTDLNGVLTIDMGEWNPVTKSVSSPIVTQKFRVRCKGVGVAGPEPGGFVILDGSSYIRCNLDLGTAINKTYRVCVDKGSPRCYDPNGAYDIYSRVYMSAALSVALGAGPGDYAPIFHHPDIGFSMSRYALSYELRNEASTSFTGASLPFPPLDSAPASIAIEYQELCSIDGAVCDTSFAANGLSHSIPSAVMNVQVTRAPVSIVIGHDPNSGVYTTGYISDIFLDPGIAGSSGDG